MELKVVSLVVMMMILLITESAMAGTRICPGGLRDCIETTCSKPPTSQCVQRCLTKCPPADTEKSHRLRHHHCKSGCSHHCRKHHDDKKKMEKCMQHCETNCISQAPSPSPSFQ